MREEQAAGGFSGLPAKYLNQLRSQGPTLWGYFTVGSIYRCKDDYCRKAGNIKKELPRVNPHLGS